MDREGLLTRANIPSQWRVLASGFCRERIKLIKLRFIEPPMYSNVPQSSNEKPDYAEKRDFFRIHRNVLGILKWKRVHEMLISYSTIGTPQYPFYLGFCQNEISKKSRSPISASFEFWWHPFNFCISFRQVHTL